MTEHPHNDRNDPVSAEELDEYLDGESPVSAAYHDLDPAEPPEALDNAILREARNEVFASGDTVGIGGFWQRWMRPLGTVAAMAFCLALVLQVLDQEPAALLDNVPAESEVLLYETRERTQEEVKKETDIYRYSASPPPVAEQPPPGRADLPQDSFGADRAAGLATPSMAPAHPAEIQEMVVITREAEKRLQDAPASVSAFSAKSTEEAETGADSLDEIAVMARKSAPEPDHRLAVNALEAWEAGARPAANVWLAGIEALLDAGETALADAEFDKLLTVYPESAGEPGSGIRTRANLADGYAASELQEQEDADAAVLDEIIVINPADELADPQVWAAGIERLMETDENALAITEIAKFRQIYPDYEL